MADEDEFKGLLLSLPGCLRCGYVECVVVKSASTAVRLPYCDRCFYRLDGKENERLSTEMVHRLRTESRQARLGGGSLEEAGERTTRWLRQQEAELREICAAVYAEEEWSFDHVAQLKIGRLAVLQERCQLVIEEWLGGKQSFTFDDFCHEILHPLGLSYHIYEGMDRIDVTCKEGVVCTARGWRWMGGPNGEPYACYRR